VPKECPRCHNIEPDYALFCSKCGYRLESQASVSTTPSKSEEIVWSGKPHPLYFLESPIFWFGVLMFFIACILFRAYSAYILFGVVYSAVQIFVIGIFISLLGIMAIEAFYRGITPAFIVLGIIYVIGMYGGILPPLAPVLMYLGYVDAVRSVEYLITTDKILIVKKFLRLTKRELLLKEIRDIIVYVGFFGRIFGYGNIIPLTGGMVDLWVVSRSAVKYSFLRGVRNPYDVETIIRSLLSSTREVKNP